MTLIEDGDVVQTFAQGDRGDHDLLPIPQREYGTEALSGT
jgi:hypothetical protein